MAISHMDDREILAAINSESIDEDSLVSREDWSTICRVRGLNFYEVDEAAWKELCRKRGYLLYRSN